jgi:hypothetical protein
MEQPLFGKEIRELRSLLTEFQSIRVRLDVFISNAKNLPARSCAENAKMKRIPE